MKNNVVTIKIGSSVLLTQHHKLDEFRIAQLADQISDLQSRGLGIILVVSGAVACGSKFIDISNQSERSKQAAAGIGQAILTTVFQKILTARNLTLAQVLLTRHDLTDDDRKKKMAEVLAMYLKAGFVPLINENDTVEPNSFGGNDFLAGEIAALTSSQRLIILSTMGGSIFGVGGGEAKQRALKQAKLQGISSMILNGKTKGVLMEALL